jgi:hypothetical protein
MLARWSIALPHVHLQVIITIIIRVMSAIWPAQCVKAAAEA